MDKRVKDLYILILKKGARVKRFTEYHHYYEIALELEAKPPTLYHAYYPEPRYIETKLIAFEKMRR